MPNDRVVLVRDWNEGTRWCEWDVPFTEVVDTLETRLRNNPGNTSGYDVIEVEVVRSAGIRHTVAVEIR